MFLLELGKELGNSSIDNDTVDIDIARVDIGKESLRWGGLIIGKESLRWGFITRWDSMVSN